MAGSHFHAGTIRFPSLAPGQILVEIVGKSTDTFTELNKTSSHKMAHCKFPPEGKSKTKSPCVPVTPVYKHQSHVWLAVLLSGSSASC